MYSFDTKEKKLILATSTEAPCKLDCKSKSQSFPSFTFTYKHLKERLGVGPVLVCDVFNGICLPVCHKKKVCVKLILSCENIIL